MRLLDFLYDLHRDRELDEVLVPEIIHDKRKRQELMDRLRAIEESIPIRYRIIEEMERQFEEEPQ